VAAGGGSIQLTPWNVVLAGNAGGVVQVWNSDFRLYNTGSLTTYNQNLNLIPESGFANTFNTTSTATSGTFNSAQILSTYNQAAATTANTDLLIKRTETAVGSGQQNLIDAKVGTISKFRVDTTGKIYGDGSGLTGVSTTSVPLSGITAATSSPAAIDSLNFAQTWKWDTLAGSSALTLSSASTAAAGNAQTVLNVATSGANAIATQTTYGAKFANTHTGASSTNIALWAVASGGSTDNYAALLDGNVKMGTYWEVRDGDFRSFKEDVIGIGTPSFRFTASNCCAGVINSLGAGTGSFMRIDAGTGNGIAASASNINTLEIVPEINRHAASTGYYRGLSVVPIETAVGTSTANYVGFFFNPSINRYI
jgi:hypothetical protein